MIKDPASKKTDRQKNTIQLMIHFLPEVYVSFINLFIQVPAKQEQGVIHEIFMKATFQNRLYHISLVSST